MTRNSAARAAIFLALKQACTKPERTAFRESRLVRGARKFGRAPSSPSSGVFCSRISMFWRPAIPAQFLRDVRGAIPVRRPVATDFQQGGRTSAAKCSTPETGK